MSCLFPTGNDSLSVEQLQSKRDANKSDRLRLAEEFQRLDAAGKVCTSIDKLDRNDLIGKMIVAGLLVVADEAVLTPADRLCLAKRRYLDEELSCLIEMKSNHECTPRPVTFHKSATYIELEKEFGARINRNDSDIQLLHRAVEEAPQDREEGELSDSEEPTMIEVHSDSISDSVTVPVASVTLEPSEKAVLEPIPTMMEPPLSPTALVSSPNQLTAKENIFTLAPTPTRMELGWQYYHRLEKLSEEERATALLEVRARHFNGNDKQNLLQLMPNFNPTTDAGILITYGKLLPPNLMKISIAGMKLIEAGRKLMGMDPEIPNRSKISPQLMSSLSKAGSQLVCVSEAEVKEVKQRYLRHHKGKKLVDLMPVFDPNTDLGKLILWGEFIPPRAMQISTLHVNQIQQMRAKRGLHPILPYHQDSTTTTAPAAASLGTAGSSFASQLSSYQNANQYPVALHDLECAVLKLRDPETNAVEKRFAKEYRGRTNYDIMPVFDPTCDLGKLILAGRKSMGKKVIVPPEHEKLLEDSQAAVRLKRSRIQRHLQRVQELEVTVPIGQRVVIPPSWIALASDATLCTAPSHKTLAEHQQGLVSGKGDKKRKADQTAPAYYNSPANKRFMASPSASPHHNTEAVSTRPEANRSEFSQAESEINQISPATPSRGGSVAGVERQETEQPMQQQESSITNDVITSFTVTNSESSTSNIAMKEVEVEGTADQSAAVSDAEQIRVEFERMKRMYEEFISK